MCLKISNLHYDAFERKFISHKAEKDLVVTKVLSNRSKDTYYTPNQVTTVKFNKYGVYNLRANGNGAHLGKRLSSIVNQGIHTRPDNYNMSLWMSFQVLCPAIIPAGTHYFVGQNKDIVSEQIFVFKDKDAFDKFVAENKCECQNISDLYETLR